MQQPPAVPASALKPPAPSCWQATSSWLTGFEDYAIAAWNEISGKSYSDGDQIARIVPENDKPYVPIQDGPIEKAPDAPLVVPPVSIVRIDLMPR